MSLKTHEIDGMPVNPDNAFEITGGVLHLIGPTEGTNGSSVIAEVFHDGSFDAVIELTVAEAANVRDWLDAYLGESV